MNLIANKIKFSASFEFDPDGRFSKIHIGLPRLLFIISYILCFIENVNSSWHFESFFFSYSLFIGHWRYIDTYSAMFLLANMNINIMWFFNFWKAVILASYKDILAKYNSLAHKRSFLPLVCLYTCMHIHTWSDHLKCGSLSLPEKSTKQPT